ncbi:MAG: HAMP domain-containing sensor histidine kinase [Christensenellales bacterium]|nr:HAMP domain-containing sensor histidine kinase [Christensenellales bacterium]
MRKRIALCMVALVLTLLGPGMALVVSRSFALTMERERARALGEEAAIARALTLETAEGNVGRSTASTLQTRYGSNELTIYLLQNGETITGEALPTVQKLPELLNTETRATLLDGVSERLLIAHALDGEITLLTALDVSPVYALRRELLRGAAALGLIGLALAGALAIWISGVLTRPLSQLADAAAKLADGDYAAPLPAAKNDEMNALIRAFSRMSAAIDERETALRTQAEERQALIDALAHEMRTPLTAILGGARLLQQSRLSGSQQSELLDTMAREASRLSTMDERLLLLTRLDHEAPAFAPFDSQAMAREALSVFDGVRLEGDDTVFVGERELTILLLRNLVVNAQRAGGKEAVRVTLHPDGFDVTDYGCGMTKEQIARAFEPFYKADKARTRSAGGAGLGLPLCRKIARLHHGELHMESEIGRGTRVCYRFDTSL